MTRSLQGKTALVTGGSRGIGRATAAELSARGARVVVTGRSMETLEPVAAEVAGHAVAMDLGDRSSIEVSVEAVRLAVGRVDILVNNAGVAAGAPLARTTDALWDQLMGVNAWGSLAMCRAFLPDMVEGGWGRVINVSSIAGLAGQAYTSAYCASKHAVVGLTRALALEFATKGVTINAVCPGWVATDMSQEAIERIASSTGRSIEEARAGLESQSPQRRMVQPQEVATLIANLAEDSSQGIHGQALAIDGGTVMH